MFAFSNSSANIRCAWATKEALPAAPPSDSDANNATTVRGRRAKEATTSCHRETETPAQSFGAFFLKSSSIRIGVALQRSGLGRASK